MLMLYIIYFIIQYNTKNKNLYRCAKFEIASKVSKNRTRMIVGYDMKIEITFVFIAHISLSLSLSINCNEAKSKFVN